MDRFARYGLLAAWVLAIVAVVGDVLALLVPAGLLLGAIGVVIATDRGVWDRMREREERRLGGRLADSRSAPRFIGTVVTAIGVLWVVAGVADVV